jgi:4-oxalomesaconate tautomerase
VRIPSLLIRGGTSRGAYFHAEHLPADDEERDAILIRIMGGPDALQVDGIGGGHPLTSKVAVIAKASDDAIDVDYLFLQVDPANQTVSSAQNCGNLLAGVGVFAIEEGLVEAVDGQTRVRVRMLNTGAICHLTLLTTDGEVAEEGDTAIDGVPGTSAPIVCDYLDIAGASCGSMLPTGNAVDLIADTEVTCVDNGMPVVVMRATDFGLSGAESPDELDANEALKRRLETIRLLAGPAMNLGDVADKSVPKMCVVAAPRAGGMIMTRTFIPHVCHKTIGVLGAVSVATACMVEGSTAGQLANVPEGNPKTVVVEHPAGSFQVRLEMGDNGEVEAAGVIRTARVLFKGEVMV